MAALRTAWPEWLSSPQIALLCCAIDPRYAVADFHMSTRDRLSKLAKLPVCEIDHIGTKHAFTGPSDRTSGNGYRWRLRLEMEDLL